jgi:hypothetical protein
MTRLAEPSAAKKAKTISANCRAPEEDLQDLLTRMRRRLYPETIPVLASYWLKTVYDAGHQLRWWKQLNHLLKRAVREPLLDDFSQTALAEIQNWVQQTIVSTGQQPKAATPQPGPSRAGLPPRKLIHYLVRLLNEWLPVEVARLLIQENESAIQDGIPVLSSAIALERILVREHLSPQTLEAMLAPELASPELFYPRDLELLRDLVLWLLGRTGAPDPPAMPATLFCVAPDSRLPPDYGRLVEQASLIRRPDADDLQVPISAAQAFHIIEDDQVRIGSIIVTMDGRWWRSRILQSGEQHSVVYQPLERFRIDYSGDHSKLCVHWPENRSGWRDNSYYLDSFRIFGREWRVFKLEADAEHTWLHLICSRVLPVSELVPVEDKNSWSLRPASVDMAWAAMETALQTSVVGKNSDAIENLRHPDLIPVGRAILQLTESVVGWRRNTLETIETQLKGLRYLQAPIVDEYGRVPWRILPAPARTALLKLRDGTHLSLLDEVIEGLPEETQP